MVALEEATLFTKRTNKHVESFKVELICLIDLWIAN